MAVSPELKVSSEVFLLNTSTEASAVGKLKAVCPEMSLKVTDV